MPILPQQPGSRSSSWINWRIMSACEPGNATSHACETVFPGKSIWTSACPRMFSTKQGEVGPTAKIQPATGAFACLVLFRGINARKAHHLTTNLQSSVTQDHDSGGARVLLVSLAGPQKDCKMCRNGQWPWKAETHTDRVSPSVTLAWPVSTSFVTGWKLIHPS